MKKKQEDLVHRPNDSAVSKIAILFNRPRLLWGLAALTILNLYVLGYLVAGKVPEASRTDEALKQLITFTALLVTLMYTLIIPRLMSEQDQRREKWLDYLVECKSLEALRQLVFGLYRLNILYIEVMGWPKFEYLRGMFPRRILRLANHGHKSGAVKELSIIRQLKHDYPDESKRRYIIALESMYEIAGLDNYLGHDGFVSFSRTRTYIYDEKKLVRMNMLLSSLNMSLAFNHIFAQTLDLAWNYEHNGDSLKGRNQYVKMIKDVIPYLNIDNTDIPNENVAGFFEPIFSKYQNSIGDTKKTLIEIVDRFTPKRYKSSFLISCIALVSGVVIPLISLSYDLDSRLKFLISMACSSICLWLLAFFLYEAYEFFNTDDIHHYRRYLEKKPLTDSMEELNRLPYTGK